ncbi:helix-turn-helix domain-containing protein [Pseudarthrobacter oxydans]
MAAAAGVSRQTVTRAMNDMPDQGSHPPAGAEVGAGARLHPSRFAKGLVQGSKDLSRPGNPSISPTPISRRLPQASNWPRSEDGTWWWTTTVTGVAAVWTPSSIWRHKWTR